MCCPPWFSSSVFYRIMGINMKNLTAIINVQCVIEAEFEVAFMEFLKANRFPESMEVAFMQKHNLSVSQFVHLQRTFYQLIFDMEAAQVPEPKTLNLKS
jgi:hypothetical protein